MIKRVFSFGCSFTHWYFWPTWADFIGINAQEYFNYGNPGSSNKMMHNRILEVDNLHKFNKSDLVLIGITAFGRYNWLEEKNNKTSWFTHGGPENWPDTNNSKFIRENLWQHKWGIYDTWLMVTNIKKMLDYSGTPYLFIMAMDNKHYLNREVLDLDEKELKMANEIFEITNFSESLQEFGKPYGNVKDDNHPKIEAHFDFVKKNFPHMITEKSLMLFDKSMSSFTEEKYVQNEIFQKLINELCPQRVIDTDQIYGRYH